MELKELVANVADSKLERGCIPAGSPHPINTAVSAQVLPSSTLINIGSLVSRAKKKWELISKIDFAMQFIEGQLSALLLHKYACVTIQH